MKALRYALRSLLQAPVFTLIAVLTLGLGIGANTAIFSVVDAVLLRPLPFPQPNDLVSVRESDHNFPTMSVSYPDYLDWVANNHTLSDVAVFRGNDAILTHAGPPADIRGQDVSWQYFPVLQIKPEFGRTFAAGDDRLGAANMIVIADSLWRQRFNARPDILGQTVELDSQAYTVIGVMPAGFPGLVTGPDAPQYWITIGRQATQDSGLLNRGSHQGFTALGRLKPGATLEGAKADLVHIARNLSQQYPKSNTGETVNVDSYLSYVVRNDSPAALWVLLASVGLVLLIACANVANLLLARAAGRQKINAIRTALGASRARLLREHLLESLCLAAAGSVFGLLLAWLAMRAAPLLITAQMGLARADQLALDGRVLIFTIGLALATSVLFGLAPAWHASQTEVASVLKEGGRESSGATSGRLRHALVVTETALALVLLVGAGLLIRSLMRLQQVDPGFNPNHVLTFAVSLPQARYPKAEQTIAFFRQARENLARIPSVSAVATAFPLPFSGNDWENSFTITGRPAPPPGQEPSTNFEAISGDYFGAMGAHLLRGRAFNDSDTATSTPVVIIDDTFAKRYWPGADPLANALGRQIHTDGKDCTVVGIISRIMEYGLDGGTEMDRLPELFIPSTQGGSQTDAAFIVRTGLADPLALRAAATAAIQAQDADQPLADMQTMDQRVALSLAQRQLTLWLMGAFAFLALTLSAIGIYGVLSYMVAQRSHEIGVRMALGAGQPRVLALVLGQGMRLAVYGAAAGLVVALLLGHFAASFLFGISGHDALTLATVPLVLLAIAALACYVPARRATRVDPCIALRGE